MDIKHEIKEEYPDYNCDYGDGAQNDYSSDGSVSDAENSQFPNLVINPFARKNNTQVESLSFISLRSIFSNKMFKNKSRLKKRIPKTEKSDSKSVFDSLLQESNNHEKKDQPAREIQDSTSSNVETSVSVQNMENSESELNLNIDKNVDVNSTSLTNDENVAKDNENSVENINCHTVNETGVSNDFDNTNVLDRITITSVQGNTSINFENDSGKVCDDEISSVFDQTPLEENNQNKEKSPNFDILETTLLSNDTAKSEDSNNVELPQSDNVTDSVCNLINKSSMDVDIDFDIDSVLQDDLNLPTMKESSKNEIYETQKNSDDMNSATNLSKPSEDPDMEYEMQEKKDGLNSDENLPKSSDDPSMDNETQNKSDDSISAENMLKPSEDLNMDYETQNKSDGLISVEDLLKPSEDLNMVYETQNKSDDLNSSENLLKPSEDLSMDYEIQKNSDVDGTNLNKLVNNEISSNILASTNNSLKNLHDARLQDVIDKSESDILDLVSDSGDDCNIIDSPEKLKALEDQLLSDEINDEKVHEIETASSTISQNNGSLGAQNFSEYDVATNEPKLENGTLLEIENKMTEESLDPQINLGVIQERNSVLEKLNSSATHSNFSNIDVSINQSNASDIDKFSDDINIDGALNDMNTDKPVDSLTH